MIIERNVTIKPLKFDNSYQIRNENLLDRKGSTHDFNTERIARIWAKYDNNGQYVKGFTYDEEMVYLPELIGISSSSNNWEKAVKDWWRSIMIRFPYNNIGLKLNTSIKLNIGKITMLPTSNTKIKVSKENFEIYCRNKPELEYLFGTPINIGDYWKWRFCLKTSQVANNIDIAKNKKGKSMEFYLFSKIENNKALRNKHLLETEAMRYFLKACENEILIEGILRVFEKGRSYRDNILFDTSYVYNELDEAKKKDILSQIHKLYPKEFIEICNDKLLTHKTFLYKAVALGVISNPSGTNLYKYGDDILGASTEETIKTLVGDKPLLEEIKLKIDAIQGVKAPIKKSETIKSKNTK